MRGLWRPWALAAAVACSGESTEPLDPIPGYVLTLSPRTLADDDVFGDDADISLVLVHDGDTDVIFLGKASASLSMPELPILGAGDTVGILVERSGGAPAAWDRDLTLAYGQVRLDKPLPDDGSAVSLDVLVTRYGAIRPVDLLSGAQTRAFAAAAMAPGGDVFLFGGLEPGSIGSTGASSRTIFKLSGTDDGNTEFERLDVDMPTTTYVTNAGDVDGDLFVAAAAALVDDDDGPLILVTGGRRDYNTPDANSGFAFLFDPATEDWVRDGADPVRIEMPNGMSWHRIVTLSSGDLLLYGGMIGAGQLSDDILVYDTGRRRFTRKGVSVAPIGIWQPSAASLGTQGALLCGGTDLPEYDVQGTDPWPATAACATIAPDGTPSIAAPLPVPMAHFAMVELADGRVLATGGMEDSLSPALNAPAASASRGAYLYDPAGNQWTATGDLNTARSSHAMLLLPDGDVLVVGGVTGQNALYANTGPAVPCAERFDPDSGTFTLLDCSAAGAGADVAIAHHPGDGAFVLAGWSEVQNTFAATGAYGVISTGPE